MSYARNTYTGNGSNTIFDISFPWNTDSPGSVVVEVAGETLAPNTYFFLNAFTQVKLNTAPANGAEVVVYRATYIEQSAVVYSPGSAIIADDLNTSNTQLLWGLQDATDAYESIADAAGPRVDQLESELNDEIQARESGDATLQGNIDAEAQARTDGLAQEASNSQYADQQLQTNIDAEASTRAQGDSSLQTQIDGIQSGTTPADAAQIQQNKTDIAANALNLQAEVGSRIDGDTNLYGGILSEAGTREAADQALQAQIDNFSGGGTDPADKAQIQTNTTQLGVVNSIIDASIYPTAVFGINNPADGNLNQDDVVNYTLLQTTDSAGLQTGVSLDSPNTITLKSNITGVGAPGRYLVELHTRALYSFGAGSGVRSLGFYMWDNAAYDYLAKSFAGTSGASTMISCNTAVPSMCSIQTVLVPSSNIDLQVYAMRWVAAATSFTDAVAEVLPALVQPTPAPAVGGSFYTGVDFGGDAWVKITRIPEAS